MLELPFETLIESKHTKTRWFPKPVSEYENAINLDTALDNVSALRKNIAYSLQYLEFLEKELAGLKLTSVLLVMIYKSYVIIGMGILEGIFSNKIKSCGWWPTSKLKSVGSVRSSEKKFDDGNQYVIYTELFQPVDEYNLRMDLDGMISKLTNHHQALGVDHKIYPVLHRLKKLRNRVHLQMVDNQYDHDYNAFDYYVKREMGQILYEILTSNTVTTNPNTINFLKVNCDETEE